MLPELRVLPLRVRPSRYETVESYASRVRDAHGIPKGIWLSWLKPCAIASGTDPRHTSAEMLERVSGVAHGHFARTAELLPSHIDGSSCVHCTTGLNKRYGCTRCSAGVEVLEEAHDGPRVCRRHSRWVGPGTDAKGQFQVGAGAINADRSYRKLRAQGVLDAHRLAEMLGCLDLWAESEASACDAAERFEAAVRLAARVLSPESLARLTASDRDPGARYIELADHVAAVMRQPAAVLVDQLWFLLRTAAYVTAESPHAFRVQPAADPRDERAYLAQAWTCSLPREKHLHLTQFVGSDRPGTRFEANKTLNLKNNYVCPLGHTFDSSKFMLRSSKASGGCGYCANKRILAGFNSLADTHPSAAAEWHPALNGDLRADQVGAGSPDEVAWLCAVGGHDSWQRINIRARGRGCTVCSNYSVSADVNSLSAIRPDLAADWHDELNAPLRPDEVLVTTERPVWWVCTVEGHEPYEMSVLQRTKGGRCRVCNRVVAHKSTSLAATHPHLLKRWDRKKNGKLRPEDVLSGSGLTAWWRCELNHSFPAIVQNMTKKFTCGECYGRVVTAENCLRTTHPHLVAEFDFARNGEFTPDNITASSTERLSWVCALGHDWPAEVRNRARGSRCLYCINKWVWVGFNDMATTRPDMVDDWDSDANGDLRPTDVVAGTNTKIWWTCEKHGPWHCTGQARSLGQGCPDCLAERIEREREAVRAAA